MTVSSEDNSSDGKEEIIEGAETNKPVDGSPWLYILCLFFGFPSFERNVHSTVVKVQ
jgi:hypothetical protein